MFEAKYRICEELGEDGITRFYVESRFLFIFWLRYSDHWSHDVDFDSIAAADKFLNTLKRKKEYKYYYR